MVEREEYIYPYAEYYEDCKKIAEWARDRGFKSIYGIPNGGLVPATYLANFLEIPLVLHKEDITRDTLIVDDIVDKGKTMNRLLVGIRIRYGIAMLFCKIADGLFRSGVAERFLARIRKRYYIATLFYKKGTVPRPDFFVHEKTVWVRYPWETEKSSRYDGTV